MSENAFLLTISGQEAQQEDIDQIGVTSGLADDHVLAEILRLAPYGGTVAKAICAAGHPGAGAPASSCVHPSGSADGSVWVLPFRAIVGSRNTSTGTPTGITTDPAGLANWRDIRSGIFIGTNASLATPIQLAPNASGHPRWDLVYATLSVDANGPAVNRRVKSAAGGLSVQSVPEYTNSPVAVAVVAGTAATTPALPVVPADGAGAYNIAIAYVRVPNGFGSTTTIVTQDIRSTTVNGALKYVDVKGGIMVRPCNANNDANANFNAGGTFAWDPSSAGSRPGPWLPPDWVGGGVFLAQVDNDTTVPGWSHASLGVVDSSTDWRNRYMRTSGVSSSTRRFAPDPLSLANTPNVPHDEDVIHTSMGSSFRADGVNPAATTRYTTIWSSTVGGQLVALLVDQNTGNLVWYSTVTGSSGSSARFVFWIETTGQFPNA